MVMHDGVGKCSAMWDGARCGVRREQTAMYALGSIAAYPVMRVLIPAMTLATVRAE
jgi:hypothetical protein